MYGRRYQRKRGFKRVVVTLLSLVMLVSVCFPGLRASADGEEYLTVKQGESITYSIDLTDYNVVSVEPSEKGLAVTPNDERTGLSLNAEKAEVGSYIVTVTYQAGEEDEPKEPTVISVTVEENTVEQTEAAKIFATQIAELQANVNSFDGKQETKDALIKKVDALETAIGAAADLNAEEIAELREQAASIKTKVEGLIVKTVSQKDSPVVPETLYEKLMACSTGWDMLNLINEDLNGCYALTVAELSNLKAKVAAMEFDDALVEVEANLDALEGIQEGGSADNYQQSTFETGSLDEDNASLKVQKVITGITMNELPEGFLSDFTVYVENIPCNMNGVLDKTWSFDNLKTGTYSIREENAQIPGYKLNVTVIGLDEGEDPDDILTQEGVNVSVEASMTILGVLDRDPSNDQLGFDVSPGHYFIAHQNSTADYLIITKEHLSYKAQASIIQLIKQEVDASSKGWKLPNNDDQFKFYSIDELDVGDIVFAGSIKVEILNDNRIKILAENQFNKHAIGTYDSTEATKADIIITNNYTSLADLIIIKTFDGVPDGENKPEVTFTVTGPNDYCKQVILDGTIDDFETAAYKAELKDLFLGEYTVIETTPLSDVGNYKFSSVTYTVGENTATDKADVTLTSAGATVEVTNTYEPKTTNVSVSKTVSGNLGNRSETFGFTASLADNSGEALSMKGITYTITIPKKDEAGNEIDEIIESGTINTDQYTFNLKHDQKITFKGVKIHAWMTLSEGTSDYTASHKVDNETEFTSGNEVKFEVGDSGNSVVFKNYKGANIETGISTDPIPYILIFSLVGISAGVLLLNKRRYTGKF